VAEIDAVKRYKGLARLPAKAPVAELVAELPKEGHHGTRVIRKGPDGALYITVGVPANVADMPPPYGTIMRYDKELKPYARGIRNSMGLDWHPETDDLWFSDNGRDWLGDDSPPEELNRAEGPDLHFGFPYRHGKSVVDPEFGTKVPPHLKMIPPVVELQAHSAPLGMRFYRGQMFPGLKNHIIVATHGSWNRSAPVGYQVLAVNPDTGEKSVLVGDWLQGRKVIARPVDVQELADGSLAISSDHSGQIFRLTNGNQTPAP
jgi:glucose/arabinose dehydrogenase